MIDRVFYGLTCVRRALGLLWRPGIRVFVLVPLLVNSVLFSIAIRYIWLRFHDGRQWFAGWMPDWLDWIAWLLLPLVIVVLVLAVYYGFTLLANLIAAPFNSLLAERVESLLRDEPAPPGQPFARLPAIAARTIASEIRKLLYQLLWLIPLIIVTLVPGVNVVAPAAWFLFGAWMMAVNYADYPMGNHDLYFADVRRRLRRDRGAALGLGGALLGMTLVPGLNFLAMPVGVVGATVYWVESSGPVNA